MAINLYAESLSDCSSPRISFSHDLPEENPTEKHEEEVIRLDKSLILDSSPDFKFYVTTYPEEHETSPADELFFNGVIIPIQMKEKLSSLNGFSKEEDQEDITATTRATLVHEEKTQSKSFWRFNRSSSLNCENFGHKRRSFWSLPLLLRSKSTGSSSANSSYDQSKQNIKQIASSNSRNSTNDCGVRLSFSTHRKPPLRKSGSTSGGVGNCAASVNGVKNSPALVVPCPYIAKGTSDLLGLSSLIRNGFKDKKSKK